MKYAVTIFLQSRQISIVLVDFLYVGFVDIMIAWKGEQSLTLGEIFQVDEAFVFRFNAIMSGSNATILDETPTITVPIQEKNPNWKNSGGGQCLISTPGQVKSQ